MNSAFALATLLVSSALLAQGPPQPGCGGAPAQVLQFPLATFHGHPTLAAHCYTPTASELAQIRNLRGYRCLQLRGLSLPNYGPVDLDLSRIDDVEPDTISLDGSPPGAIGNPDPTDMTLWYGGVRYFADSRVCIAFSEVGVWGWVRTDGRLFQIGSSPQNGSWTTFDTLIFDDRDKNNLAGSRCGDAIDEPPELPPDYRTCLAGLSPASWHEQCPDLQITQLRRCAMAVETDYQFYRRFGDVAAAEVYARFVLGAVAQQLRLAARVVIEVNYLGIYSTPNDPWLQQDSPPNSTYSPCCVDVVYEFQHRWGTEDLASRGPRFNLGPGLGLAPVTADLHHMISGATMGCAVAIGRIGVGDAFSLSSGMGPLNLDQRNIVDSRTGAILYEPAPSVYFQIYGAGHEIGHNFGAPHTHNLRIDVNGTPNDPTDDVPVDRCAAQPGGGAANCSSTGFATATLMSYCHACSPEFLRNLRMEYHPEIARCMRQYVATLPDFEDVHFVTDLGFAHAPAGVTPPRLTFTGYSPGMDRVKLSCSDVPASGWRALVISLDGDYLPVLGARIVPGVDALWAGQPATEPLDIPIPDGLPNGVLLYFQQLFATQTDLYASNAIALELIR